MVTYNDVKAKSLEVLRKIMAAHLNLYFKLLSSVAQKSAQENYSVEVGPGYAYLFNNINIEQPRFRFTYNGSEVEVLSRVYDSYSPGTVTAEEVLENMIKGHYEVTEDFFRLKLCEEGGGCRVVKLDVVGYQIEINRAISNLIYADLAIPTGPIALSIILRGAYAQKTISNGYTITLGLGVGRICLAGGDSYYCDYGRLLEIDYTGDTRVCVEHYALLGDCVEQTVHRILILAENFMLYGEV